MTPRDIPEPWLESMPITAAVAAESQQILIILNIMTNILIYYLPSKNPMYLLHGILSGQKVADKRNCYKINEKEIDKNLTFDKTIDTFCQLG